MAAPTLTFLGAARTVTGSRFLLEHGTARVLVDCGLFQGLKELRLRNWEPFPVDPATIDAVVLTHAHVDHCGYLPRLCAGGFRGRVLATPATVELAGIVLPDSGHLQEEEAAYANRMGFSKHRPALPLYTEAEAVATLDRFVPLPFGEPAAAAAGVRATLRPAGHILGSATVTVELDGMSRPLVFSGDLGRPHHPLLVPPAPVGPAAWIVVESTYGDQLHDEAGAVARLGEVVARTLERGGSVLIPAFAVDRTEVILFHLAQLVRSGAVPAVPVYVDSPMALDTLAVYRRALDDAGPDVRPGVRADVLEVGRVVEVRDVEGSKRLNDTKVPSIVVSASGMATGGRVVHHLRHRLPDHRNTVVLPGFQAEGTRGRRLVDGAREVKMLGRYVRVRAEIVHLPGFSVHADQRELIDWLATAEDEPEGVLCVHGEPAASQALAAAVEDRFDWVAAAPTQGERVSVRDLDTGR